METTSASNALNASPRTEPREKPKARREWCDSCGHMRRLRHFLRKDGRPKLNATCRRCLDAKRGTCERDLDDSEREYAVERVCSHRRNPSSGQLELLIKWVGYEAHESTWEPLENTWRLDEYAKYATRNPTLWAPLPAPSQPPKTYASHTFFDNLGRQTIYMYEGR